MLELKPELSVVIPAYNEADRIETTLNDLMNSDDLPISNKCEVLVVMDGCTDGTPRIVREIINHNPNATALVFPKRLGKGGAIMEALKYTKGDVIAFIDADGSVSTSELCRLIKLADRYDLVIGSRYTDSSKISRKRTVNRTLMSRSFNVLSKLMFRKLWGLKDTQCGVKVFSRRLLDVIKNDFLITDFAFDINLIYSSLSFGFKVKEIGISWQEKDGSKLSGGFGKHSFLMIVSLLRLRIYYSRFRKILYSRNFESLGRLFYSWLRA